MTAANASQVITHKRILTIALPIVLSNASIPLLGVVDTAVVGQMGAAAPIGAVAIGATILAALYWIFGFLRMGTTGLAAQAVGEGNRAEVAALLTRVLMIGGCAGLVLILLQGPIFWAAFRLSPASAEVEDLARSYIAIRIWSAPAAIATFGILGWLIATERTSAVLVIQLWINLCNIALDLWFVLGLGWGVDGVALATFVAEWSGLALGLWICRGAFRHPSWRDMARIFDKAKLIGMARVNSDILIRSAFLQAIFLSFLFYAAAVSDQTLAANQVLMQFMFIAAYVLDGFAYAVETLVGQSVGARERAPLRRAAKLCSLWGVALGLVLALMFWLLGDLIINIMSTDPAVRAEARIYLPWLILGPLLSVASFMLDGIFVGATRTADMRNMMALSAAIYFAAVYVLMPVFGNHGLWAALMISFVARGVTLALRYPALERAIKPHPVS